MENFSIFLVYNNDSELAVTQIISNLNAENKTLNECELREKRI